MHVSNEPFYAIRIVKSLLKSLCHIDSSGDPDGNQVSSSVTNKPALSEDNDFYDMCNCSAILGNHYSRKTRVRPPMVPADLSHDFSKPLTIYSEVLYEDLDNTEKYFDQLCNNKYKSS